MYKRRQRKLQKIEPPSCSPAPRLYQFTDEDKRRSSSASGLLTSMLHENWPYVTKPTFDLNKLGAPPTKHGPLSIEYVAAFGLDAKNISSKTLGKCEDVADADYNSSIIAQFPGSGAPGTKTDLDKPLTHLCFPYSCKIRLQSTPPKTTMHTFLQTDEERRVRWGHCVVYHHPIQNPHVLKLWREANQSDAAIRQYLHEPVAICVLTSQPIHTTIRTFLRRFLERGLLPQSYKTAAEMHEICKDLYHRLCFKVTHIARGPHVFKTTSENKCGMCAHPWGMPHGSCVYCHRCLLCLSKSNASAVTAGSNAESYRNQSDMTPKVNVRRQLFDSSRSHLRASSETSLSSNDSSALADAMVSRTVAATAHAHVEGWTQHDRSRATEAVWLHGCNVAGSHCAYGLPAVDLDYGELVRLLVVAKIPPQTLIAILQCLLVGQSAVVMAPKSVDVGLVLECIASLAYPLPVHVAVTFIPIIDRNYAARFVNMPFHFLMGVHFDAFKGKKSKPETPGKEPKPRASLDPQDAARAAEMEWVTFAKHLRLEVAEEFEIPENVVLINLGSGVVANAVYSEGSEIWSIPGVPDLPGRLYLRLVDALMELHDTHTHIGTVIPTEYTVLNGFSVGDICLVQRYDTRRIPTVLRRIPTLDANKDAFYRKHRRVQHGTRVQISRLYHNTDDNHYFAFISCVNSPKRAGANEGWIQLRHLHHMDSSESKSDFSSPLSTTLSSPVSPPSSASLSPTSDDQPGLSAASLPSPKTLPSFALPRPRRVFARDNKRSTVATIALLESSEEEPSFADILPLKGEPKPRNAALVDEELLWVSLSSESQLGNKTKPLDKKKQKQIFGICRKAHRLQCLYRWRDFVDKPRMGDLHMNGNIKALQLKLKMPERFTLQDFRIGYAQTDLDDLSLGWMETEACFGPVSIEHHEGGWYTFELSQPIRWDVDRNFVLQLSYRGQTTKIISAQASLFSCSEPLGDPVTRYHTADNYEYPFTAPTSVAASRLSVPGTTAFSVLNLRLRVNEPPIKQAQIELLRYKFAATMVSLFKSLRESMSVCSQKVANELLEPSSLSEAIRESFLANISNSYRKFMTTVCDSQLFAQFIQQRDSLPDGDAFDQWCYHKMKLRPQLYLLQQNRDVYGILYKASGSRQKWNKRAFMLHGTVLRYGDITTKMGQALKQLNKRLSGGRSGLNSRNNSEGAVRTYDESYLSQIGRIIKQHFVEKDRIQMHAGISEVEVPSASSGNFVTEYPFRMWLSPPTSAENSPANSAGSMRLYARDSRIFVTLCAESASDRKRWIVALKSHLYTPEKLASLTDRYLAPGSRKGSGLAMFCCRDAEATETTERLVRQMLQDGTHAGGEGDKLRRAILEQLQTFKAQQKEFRRMRDQVKALKRWRRQAKTQYNELAKRFNANKQYGKEVYDAYDDVCNENKFLKEMLSEQWGLVSRKLSKENLAKLQPLLGLNESDVNNVSEVTNSPASPAPKPALAIMRMESGLLPAHEMELEEPTEWTTPASTGFESIVDQVDTSARALAISSLASPTDEKNKSDSVTNSPASPAPKRAFAIARMESGLLPAHEMELEEPTEWTTPASTGFGSIVDQVDTSARALAISSLASPTDVRNLEPDAHASSGFLMEVADAPSPNAVTPKANAESSAGSLIDLVPVDPTIPTSVEIDSEHSLSEMDD